VKKQVYYCGEPPAKYGIWNKQVDGWQFGICEDTPMLAMARLYQKISIGAKNPVFEPRKLPKQYWRNDDE